MKHYLIFAGTSEGRLLTEFFLTKDVLLHVCVTTEYAKELLPVHERLTVSTNAMNEKEMYAFLRKHSFDKIFDTTHPYAKDATKNIRAAAKDAAIPYVRVLRPKETFLLEDAALFFDSITDAVSYLNNTTGAILVTTGSKELDKFCLLNDYKERVYARILPNPPMVQRSYDLGFTGSHLICMQGPFSEELNIALLHQFHISYLVTKDSGTAGGFFEKVESAKKAGASLIVIGRPQEEDGISLETLFENY